ncbi:hypothetical protein Poli38472_014811 [Pythium oligandrum]|uniref:PX domain-containing protein n=1 Tax=Pythium oligandrum TaxID=41045 RepID=A0A8K1FIJ7_PYTOL|nr:hypothetical protein Poli38472_014811 [Pythium oligandrum]|eukprot:TMW63901.1 hypothetical protein Poli38472_014811 [Pythium oligandrum]
MTIPTTMFHDAPVSPLSVRVLRFFPEEKQSVTSLKKTRFVYEIETCHQATGDIFRAERRFRDFKQLRDGLLAECRNCKHCRVFVEHLKNSRLPSRSLLVMDANKYGHTRMLELTTFLTELVELVTRHGRLCGQNGPDVDKSVGLFLGVSSLSEAEDAVAAVEALIGARKSRRDRLDFRPASMADFRFSASSMEPADEDMEKYRLRGFSDAGVQRY